MKILYFCNLSVLVKEKGELEGKEGGGVCA